MDNASYVALTRQSGLFKQLNIIANNIANVNTAGYRREATSFSEHIKALDMEDPSLSMAVMNRHIIDLSQGEVTVTDNKLDFAIEGDAFFLVETPNGERLTRAGSFTLNGQGELSTQEGFRVLNNGGGALAIPAGTSAITASADGTLSADGQAIGQIGMVTTNRASLTREGDNVFSTEEGYEPATDARLLQGAVEGSNVNAVTEIAHLIEVQRTYEMGQRMLQQEDDRIKDTIRKMTE